MTRWKGDPMDALIDGFNEAAFLMFREGCEYLSRRELMFGYQDNECTHEKNPYTKEFDGPAGKQLQLGACVLTACPIFKRLGR